MGPRRCGHQRVVLHPRGRDLHALSSPCSSPSSLVQLRRLGNGALGAVGARRHARLAGRHRPLLSDGLLDRHERRWTSDRRGRDRLARRPRRDIRSCPFPSLKKYMEDNSEVASCADLRYIMHVRRRLRRAQRYTDPGRVGALLDGRRQTPTISAPSPATSSRTTGPAGRAAGGDPRGDPPSVAREDARCRPGPNPPSLEAERPSRRGSRAAAATTRSSALACCASTGSRRGAGWASRATSSRTGTTTTCRRGVAGRPLGALRSRARAG